VPKNVSGGFEGLQDVLPKSKFQDYEAKSDSLDVDPLKEVSGGVEGLKELLTESNYNI